MHIVGRIFLVVLLVLASAQDIKERKIANKLNVAGLLCGLVLSFFRPDITFGESALGAAVALGVGFACWMLKIFRAGDAKLLCAVGAFVGWKMSLNCLLLAILVGAVAGIPLLIKRLVKKEKGFTKFPFATAITAGTLIGVHIGYIWELINLF